MQACLCYTPSLVLGRSLHLWHKFLLRSSTGSKSRKWTLLSTGPHSKHMLLLMGGQVQVITVDSWLAREISGREIILSQFSEGSSLTILVFMIYLSLSVPLFTHWWISENFQSFRRSRSTQSPYWKRDVPVGSVAASLISITLGLSLQFWAHGTFADLNRYVAASLHLNALVYAFVWLLASSKELTAGLSSTLKCASPLWLLFSFLGGIVFSFAFNMHIKTSSLLSMAMLYASLSFLHWLFFVHPRESLKEGVSGCSILESAPHLLRPFCKLVAGFDVGQTFVASFCIWDLCNFAFLSLPSHLFLCLSLASEKQVHSLLSSLYNIFSFSRKLYPIIWFCFPVLYLTSSKKADVNTAIVVAFSAHFSLRLARISRFKGKKTYPRPPKDEEFVNIDSCPLEPTGSWESCWEKVWLCVSLPVQAVCLLVATPPAFPLLCPLIAQSSLVVHIYQSKCTNQSRLLIVITLMFSFLGCFHGLFSLIWLSSFASLRHIFLLPELWLWLVVSAISCLLLARIAIKEREHQDMWELVE